jgi:hypothetical protein
MLAIRGTAASFTEHKKAFPAALTVPLWGPSLRMSARRPSSNHRKRPQQPAGSRDPSEAILDIGLAAQASEHAEVMDSPRAPQATCVRGSRCPRQRRTFHNCELLIMAEGGCSGRRIRRHFADVQVQISSAGLGPAIPRAGCRRPARSRP